MAEDGDRDEGGPPADGRVDPRPRARPRIALISLDLTGDEDPRAATRHALEMLAAFTDLGAEVELFASTPSLRTLSRELRGLTVHPVTVRAGGGPPARERSAIAANVALGLQLRGRPPFDLVFERFSAWSHAGIDYAVEAAIPAFLQLGASHLACKLPSQDHRTLAEAIGMQAFGGATAVVASGPEVARCMEMRWGCAPEIRPEERPEPPESLRRFVRSGLFTVGFAGDLEPGLGLLDLADAFSLLHHRRPHARLLLLGHGSERPLLEAEFSRQRLSHALRITGWVPPDRRPALLELMDVAVAPFPTAGSVALAPFSVYEAMVAGLPVVASRVAPLSQVLAHGRTGFTFEPRNVEQLVRVLELLDDDGGLRREMGRLGRERVLRKSAPLELGREVLAIAGFRADAPGQLPVGAS